MGNANHYQFKNYQPMIEEFSDSTMSYADMAEIILDNALYLLKKENLMKDIDNALIEGNKENFIQLSTQYNALIDKYRYLKEYQLGDKLN